MDRNILMLLILFSGSVICISKPKSGPFISTLVRVEKCSSPQNPYQPDPPGEVTAELYDTGSRKNLLRGNYTALRPDSTLKLSVQDYFMVDGKWQLIFRVKNMTCRSQLVAVMGKLFGIDFNRKTCSVPKGPFISTLVRVEKCSSPQNPYQPDPPGEVTAELYDTGSRKNLLRGNYTALRPDSTLKLSVQDYFMVDGKWQLIFRVKNMTCRSQLVAVMGKLFGIDFNRKTCSVPKGTYVFSNIDYDFVDHVYMMTREYGRNLRTVEVSSKQGTVLCLEFEAVVTPKVE